MKYIYLLITTKDKLHSHISHLFVEMCLSFKEKENFETNIYRNREKFA